MLNIDEAKRVSDLNKELKSHNINVNDLKNSEALKIYETPEYSSEMTEAERLIRKLTFRIQENEKQIEELKNHVTMMGSDISGLIRIRKEEAARKELEKPAVHVQAPVQKKVLVKQAVQDDEDPYAEIYETVDNTPNLKKPIDRTRVAPADVQIDKVFYFGNKR